MNAVTNPQLYSSVDTDEHENLKERGHITITETTPNDNTKSHFDTFNHDSSVKKENESDTSYHQELSNTESRHAQKTEEPQENVKDDNWMNRDDSLDSFDDKTTQEQRVKDDDTKEDSETEIRQTLSKTEDSRDDTKVEAYENHNAKDDATIRDDNLDNFDDKTTQERSVKDDDTKEDSETEIRQAFSISDNSRDDMKVEADEDHNAKDDATIRDDSLDNLDDKKTQERSVQYDNTSIKETAQTETPQERSKTEYPRDEQPVAEPEETFYHQDKQRAEEPEENNIKDDNWMNRDESLDNRHETKVHADDTKIPSSDLWNQSTNEPETDDKVTEYKPTDDDTSIRTERLVVDNDTRDTFSISAREDDIGDSLVVEKAKIDDDSFIHTERLVVDDEDSRDTLSVPSEIETYKKTDEDDDDTFNRREKLLIDDKDNTRDTHTLSVPSDTETSYQFTTDEETNDNTFTHHQKTQTGYDTNEPIREEVFNVDNSRHNKEFVSHDDDKGAVELENQTDYQSDEEFADLSPGMILRQARERHNLSVKHIADRLYLDVHVIEALETDDYETLPPTIFVRGYLRNYAKLLEIPTTSIMGSFDKTQKPTAVPIITAPSKPKKQASSKDLWPTIVSFAVAICLLIGVALWQFYPNTTSEPQLTVTPDTPGDSFSPVINGPPVIETEPQITGMNGIDADNEPLTTPSTPDENPPNEGETAEEPASSEPTLQTMQVRFKERSWVRISDKTGNRLYQGTGNAGEILPLEGTQPFQVHVGNVDGVSVEYNGEIKDIRNYPRQRRNRRVFIVGNND